MATSDAVVRPAGDDGHDALRGVAVPQLGAVAGAGGGQGRREDFVHGAHDGRRVMRVDQPVRAFGYGDRPLRGRAQGEAGNPEHRALLLDAARVGEQEARRRP